MDDQTLLLSRRVAWVEAQASKRIDALESDLKALRTTVQAQQRAFDAALTSAVTAAIPPATSWRYDARMPNTISDKLGLPERDANGIWSRWFIGGSFWKIDLALLPRRQYEIVVVAPRFHTEAACHSFYVRANGQDLEWLRWTGIERSTIAELGDSGALALILTVAPPAERGDEALFAVSSIELRAL